MKNIVFYVGTEYHLITSLGIIRQYYSMGYLCYVIRISHIDGARLNNLSFVGTGIRYYEIVYDYNNPNKRLKEDLQIIIDLKPEKFFFFLEGKFWMNYLFSKLHKNGTTIVLGPDGMKVYNNHTTFIKDRIASLIKGLYFSAKTHLLPTLPHIERCYATSKYIDEVWVEYPQFFLNRTNKKVVEFHYNIDKAFVDLLNRVFCVDEKDMSIIRNESTILYLDSPYSTEDYYARTCSILSAIQKKHPGVKVLIKYHPLSKNIAHVVFSKMPNIYELNPDYPAELYIAAAKQSIIVSLISTSELLYNPGCVYYWIYGLFDDLYCYNGIANPTDYIIVAKSVDDIR